MRIVSRSDANELGRNEGRLVDGRRDITRPRRIRPSGERGLTLVEVLVVLAVIAVLVGLLIPVVGRSREKTRRVQCQTVLKQVYLVTTMYADDHDGRLPNHGLFFDNNDFVAQCPSATPTFGPVTYGGYSWGAPYAVVDKTMNDIIKLNWTMASDSIPWHDPKRSVDAEGRWDGLKNTLLGSGQVEWK